MNYKLLALDLDGTTLGPGLAIDPAVSIAIAAAQAQGVRVTIATTCSRAIPKRAASAASAEPLLMPSAVSSPNSECERT
ncbi:MAG TPA: HAD hydrolase family protein, partial [Roseiflexaceae bacterium]